MTRTTQVFRNQLSTLNSFVLFHGKTFEARVGRELQGAFDERSRAYLDAVKGTPHTKADRRSHLRRWREAVEQIFAERKRVATEKPKSDDETSAFHRQLRLALAEREEKPKTLARRVGVSTSALARWLNGAYPNKRALPSLHRLEHALGLANGLLRSLIPQTRGISTGPKPAEAQKPGFRQRLRRQKGEHYSFKEVDITADFELEWKSLFDYKTSKRPTYRRSTKGVWRMLPLEKVALKLRTLAKDGQFGCPTAEMNLRVTMQYLGFLSIDAESGGKGIAKNDLQTIAWLAIPEMVDAFLRFRTQRSDGLIHGGHLLFTRFVQSITHPDTGFLSQQPEYAKKLPEVYRDEDWQRTCNETWNLCKTWTDDAQDVSRNPEEPIRGLLNLREPLAPIMRAVDDLDAAAATTPSGSILEGIHKRDALLLSLLIANPLRRRNLILMRWTEDNGGNLYRRQDGQWRLRFAGNDFKNEKGAAKGPYDAPLPRALGDRIVEYLEEFRPRLVRRYANVDWVFPSSRSPGAWDDLSKHVQVLTARLVTETPGIGPHAFRHLVATDYLRKHPNDYPTVAKLLHDNLETVLSEYAHLRFDDAFGRYEEHLGRIGKVGPADQR